MPTIRQLVRDIQIEVRETDLQPDRAAELLTKLASLIGNIADEKIAADLAYNAVHLALFQEHGAASRAKLFADVTPEYARKREAQACDVLATELIRALKAFLKTKQEERQWAGHQ